MPPDRELPPDRRTAPPDRELPLERLTAPPDRELPLDRLTAPPDRDPPLERLTVPLDLEGPEDRAAGRDDRGADCRVTGLVVDGGRRTTGRDGLAVVGRTAGRAGADRTVGLAGDARCTPPEPVRVVGRTAGRLTASGTSRSRAVGRRIAGRAPVPAAGGVARCTPDRCVARCTPVRVVPCTPDRSSRNVPASGDRLVTRTGAEPTVRELPLVAPAVASRGRADRPSRPRSTTRSTSRGRPAPRSMKPSALTVVLPSRDTARRKLASVCAGLRCAWRPSRRESVSSTPRSTAFRPRPKFEPPTE